MSSSQGSSSTGRTQEQPQQTSRLEGRLRLVGHEESPRRQVQWTEDTVDNENMNLKKSKICCIFHPTKEFGESSEEDSDYSSSSSESESDSDSENENQPVHSHSHSHSHSHRRPRPNAYERKPRIK